MPSRLIDSKVLLIYLTNLIYSSRLYRSKLKAERGLLDLYDLVLIKFDYFNINSIRHFSDQKHENNKMIVTVNVKDTFMEFLFCNFKVCSAIWLIFRWSV